MKNKQKFIITASLVLLAVINLNALSCEVNTEVDTPINKQTVGVPVQDNTAANDKNPESIEETTTAATECTDKKDNEVAPVKSVAEVAALSTLMVGALGAVSLLAPLAMIAAIVATPILIIKAAITNAKTPNVPNQ